MLIGYVVIEISNGSNLLGEILGIGQSKCRMSFPFWIAAFMRSQM